MIVRCVLVVTLSAIVLVAPLALSARRMESAQSLLESSRSQLRSTTNTAQRVMDLRVRKQQIADRKRPEQDVIARVTSSLARAGVPSDRLAGLRPDSDSALRIDSDEGTYRRQAIRFSLTRLSIAELGAFLSDWRRSHPLWTPTQIELLHARNQTDVDRYDVSILLSTIYLAEQ